MLHRIYIYVCIYMDGGTNILGYKLFVTDTLFENHVAFEHRQNALQVQQRLYLIMTFYFPAGRLTLLLLFQESFEDLMVLNLF